MVFVVVEGCAISSLGPRLDLALCCRAAIVTAGACQGRCDWEQGGRGCRCCCCYCCCYCCSTTRPSCRHALGCWQTPQCLHCALSSLPASGTRWQNQGKKLFPCCLATTGKPSSGSKAVQRGKEEVEERKKTDLERIFCCNLPN